MTCSCMFVPLQESEKKRALPQFYKKKKKKEAFRWLDWCTVGFVLKLEYARPPAAVKLVAQWTDWGHIWGQLICKSNKAPEIESYVAHPQVSRPDNMPAPLLLPQEVIMTKSKSSGVDLWPWVCCWPWQRCFRTFILNVHVKRVAVRTDEDLGSFSDGDEDVC